MRHASAILVAMWTAFLVNQTVFSGKLNAFGLQPRNLHGLIGIATAPFLHINLAHLQGNTFAYVFLAGLLILKNAEEFPYAFWGSALIGGLGNWAMGNPAAISIGASGAIYGLFGYLISGGFFCPRSLPDLMATGLTAAWFFSMSFGMLPGFVSANVSWEAHLCGFIAGVIVSYRINKNE